MLARVPHSISPLPRAIERCLCPNPPPRESISISATLNAAGYLREDGLWEIEGHIVDTKTYSFHNSYRGVVETGEPVHDMWLRLTIDDSMRIREVEAVTDHGPFRTCPAITANFKRLEGLTIGPGFRRAVRERVGGLQGCTHLVELVGPVATTAFQTMTARRQDHGTQEAKAGTDAGRTRRGVHRSSTPATRSRATVRW